MLTVAIRSSRPIYSAQLKRGCWVGHTENCQRLPDAIGWAYAKGMRQKLSSNLQPKRPTVGEWDECSNVVYELCLLYRIREVHRPLSDQPSLGPELVGERVEVPRVPM